MLLLLPLVRHENVAVDGHRVVYRAAKTPRSGSAWVTGGLVGRHGRSKSSEADHTHRDYTGIDSLLLFLATKQPAASTYITYGRKVEKHLLYITVTVPTQIYDFLARSQMCFIYHSKKQRLRDYTNLRYQRAYFDGAPLVFFTVPHLSVSLRVVLILTEGRGKVPDLDPVVL